jgi:multisubunit Na+/H+ antiporter MnhE subunit
MVQDLLREGLLLFRHIQLMERWLLLLYHRTLLIEAALTVARMVWKEKREIVPEIWLCLHLLYDLTDMLVEVITEGKHAH